MKWSGNHRRALRAGCALAAVTVSSAAVFVSQGAASGVVAKATAYQDSTIAAAMARKPGGVRIAPAVVEWNRGTVVMTVPSTPRGNVAALPSSATAGAPTPPRGSRSSCPTGELNQWSCVYNQTYWNGTRLEFQSIGYYQDLYSYGGTSWVTLSWVNQTDHRTWLNQYANHSNSGASLCMTGGGAGSNSFGPWSADRWIYLSSNTAHC